MSLNAIIGHSERCSCCLSDISPKDKPWDVRKRQSRVVARKYREMGADRYAERMDDCARWLEFAIESSKTLGELVYKLCNAQFCRVRHCPVCQWRRSLMWLARFHEALPKIFEVYPTHRFIFLTLTVRNCDLDQLRETLTWMNKAWVKLTQRKQFPAVGFLKSTEVTRAANGQAHPHFHCLLMVPPGYFGRKYLTQKDWTNLWQSCLKVEYTPITHIRVVKPRNLEVEPTEGLMVAIKETLKYSVKPEDLVNSPPEWLDELTRQLHKTRAVSIGGILRQYLSEEEPEDYVGGGKKKTGFDSTVMFGWRELLGRYAGG